MSSIATASTVQSNNYPVINKAMWSIWIILFVVTCIFLARNNFYYHTLTIFYRDGSYHWFQGQPLYNNTGWGFIYFPQSAILFAPIAYLPQALGEVFWRIISIGLFAFGIYRFAYLFGEANKKYAAKLFAVMTVVTIPLTTTNATNGQMQLLMAGLLLLAFADIYYKRWWRAASLLTLALAFKPTAIVLFLLALALYPQLRYKMLVTTLILLVLPFLTQNPHYVISQYVACWHMLETAAKVGTSDPRWEWAQLFRMTKFFTDYLVSPLSQYLIRIIAAAITLGLCYYAKLRFNKTTALYFIFTLGMCYLLLFNPRTENDDYMMIMPMVGYFIAQALFITRRNVEILILAAITLLMYANHGLSHYLTPGNNIWLKPMMTVFLTGTVIWHLFIDKRG